MKKVILWSKYHTAFCKLVRQPFSLQKSHKKSTKKIYYDKLEETIEIKSKTQKPQRTNCGKNTSNLFEPEYVKIEEIEKERTRSRGG